MARQLSIDPRVLRRLRDLPEIEKKACLLVLLELVDAFGRPHLHSGLGIRKLGGKLFECRCGLGLRFIFQDRAAELFIAFLGTHDEVKALLRGTRAR